MSTYKTISIFIIAFVSIFSALIISMNANGEDIAKQESELIVENKAKDKKMANSVHDFKVKELMGKEVSLADYKGKVLLIVNVASQCGLTPQYKSLQAMYEKYNSQGLEILGFPCNQFGGQEPGTSEEIRTFCDANYAVTFPLFDKIDVNGEKTHPLYLYLKANAAGFINDDIKWNFTKFLIDKNGKVIDRFAPTTTPDSFEDKIAAALK